MKIIFFESILFIFALFCFVVAVFGQKFVVLLAIDVFYVVFKYSFEFISLLLSN